ncbi:MAG: NAD-dependent deacetylase [Magnetococcales bacterium]|nr:NAD-dependent deacetylase [Magnetococcales bacterium]
MNMPADPIARAAREIAAADGLLVTAGAGMGVDSGLPDFRGESGFWRAYPVIARLGISFPQMANPSWFRRDPRLAWAFYGHRLSLYRATPPHVGFRHLLEMGAGLPFGCHVLTSNVDGHFQQAGFDPERIEECHGSIHHLQCTLPCSEEIWEAAGTDIAIDEEHFRAVGSLPTCPRCGALARPNILMFGDGAWLAWRTERQTDLLRRWLANLAAGNRRLVIVEIGAGHAVPTIRQSSEYYAARLQATLIRINPRDHDIPGPPHIALPMGGLAGIEGIKRAWGNALTRPM